MDFPFDKAGFLRLYELYEGGNCPRQAAAAVFPKEVCTSPMKQRTPHRLILPALLLLSTSMLAQKPEVLPAPSPAQEKTAPALPQTPQVHPQLSREDLEAFFDGFIPIELQRDDIGGAVVAVVKDGNVLFAKGYGYSDVKNRKLVTVDATLFRPGSISKTFTWTAVMQLYEQGKLDLDRDVNDYLDFKIPARFG
jgi:CubicO group peptidase (beta-lactamase class C family)